MHSECGCTRNAFEVTHLHRILLICRRKFTVAAAYDFSEHVLRTKDYSYSAIGNIKEFLPVHNSCLLKHFLF